MKNRTLILGGIVALIAIILVAWLFLRDGSVAGVTKQEVSTSNPLDIVFDFYEPWLAALHSKSTDPYQEGLADNPLLSKELRERIKDSKDHSDTEPDPVVCQTIIPAQISARPINQSDENTQILVMSREKGHTEQAIVTLLKLNDGWYISDIMCSPGEFAPEREFSFEMEGYLLKSVVPPLDSRNWHLVFEQNGVKGHVVPLFFGAESTCVKDGGTESVCAPDTFVEPSKAMVHGQMTEAGVEVKRLELMQ